METTNDAVLHTAEERLLELTIVANGYCAEMLKARVERDGAVALRASDTVLWRQMLAQAEADLKNVTEAGSALISDVRRRYPGEALRCQYMIALDEAINDAIVNVKVR